MKSDQTELDRLKRIFEAATLAPVLKHNSKFPQKGTARIAYSDVMECNIVVREDTRFPESGNFWDDTKAPVIAEYESLEDLVMDGWCLD